MLFTYTDKDGFDPPYNANGGGLTTGAGGQFSHLEEAVTNKTRKAAISSSETAGGGGPGGAQEGSKLDYGSMGNTSEVSDTAAVIQTHLAREDKVKVKKYDVNIPCQYHK